MICPNCESENCHFVSQTYSSGGDLSSACCGLLLLGPIGILCSWCGAGEKTKEFWVCDNCGTKFQRGLEKKTDDAPHTDQNKSLPAPKKALNLEIIPTQSGPQRGNILNNRLVDEKNGILYYVKDKGDGKTSIVRRWEIRAEEIFIGGMARYLFASENGLYFMIKPDEENQGNIFYLANDSNEPMQISESQVEQIYYDGSHIYYLNSDDSSRLYRMKTDGTDNQGFILRKCGNLIVTDDRVYFIDLSRKMCITSVAKDGSDEKCHTGNEKVRRFLISNGKLYYRLNMAERVFESDLITGDKKLIADFNLGYEWENVIGKVMLLRHEDVVYFYRQDDEDFTYCISPNEPVKTINVIGDYIYCGGQNGIYGRVRSDANGRELL